MNSSDMQITMDEKEGIRFRDPGTSPFDISKDPPSDARFIDLVSIQIGQEQTRDVCRFRSKTHQHVLEKHLDV